MSETDLIGYVASGLVFFTFCSRSMQTLRSVALLSNLAFISYGWIGDLMPVLLLHAALLPINLHRLWTEMGLRGFRALAETRT